MKTFYNFPCLTKLEANLDLQGEAQIVRVRILESDVTLSLPGNQCREGTDSEEGSQVTTGYISQGFKPP